MLQLQRLLSQEWACEWIGWHDMNQSLQICINEGMKEWRIKDFIIQFISLSMRRGHLISFRC